LPPKIRRKRKGDYCLKKKKAKLPVNNTNIKLFIEWKSPFTMSKLRTCTF
jgi:hypothetical protein